MKKELSPEAGLGTLVNHYTEGDHALHAHLSPIYQTSTFGFPDVDTAKRIFSGEEPGYVYTRTANPNVTQLARKYAMLEGLDLLRRHPGVPPEEIVAGRATSSGLAAISAAVLSRVDAGDTVITQRSLYGNAFSFWHDLAPRFDIKVVWVDDLGADAWASAFAAHPEATLAYTETPSNPTMELVDLRALADTAHAHDAWVMVDNTFATPYSQRPLTLGCDVVVHSTTKYLSGHGQIIGGAIVSPHLEYMNPRGKILGLTAKLLGVAPSPFDAWLANVGLKTFEIRMERHCTNGLAMAGHLAGHPCVARVYYPGLPDSPYYALAQRQMFNGFGGMLAFELKGGYEAGVTLMNSLRIPLLAVSLGNVDSLIQHPASMTHAVVPPEERRSAGISDGLIRLSVGIENIEDLISDMDQALARVDA